MSNRKQLKSRLYIINAVGNVKWCIRIENSLAIPQKRKTKGNHMSQQFHSQVKKSREMKTYLYTHAHKFVQKCPQ